MGYRGSKSIINNIIVKEQRVHGSWCGVVVSSKGRYTLKGFSRNYRVKILTKANQIIYKSPHGRSYTSIAIQQDLTPNIMNPWFVTGFSDAEACFTLSVVRNKERKVGWRVHYSFQITLHKKDKALLEQIQSYFLVGSITSYFLVGSIIFDIDSFLLCAIIPIKSYSNAEADKGKILSENTNKSGIYIWKNLVNKKQYIGSSDNLRRRFNNYFNPNHLLTKNYMSSTSPTLHPWFITGFAYAESSFILLINKNSQYKTGYSLQICFSINLHKKDRALLEKIASFYGVGNITTLGSKHSEESKQKISDAMIGNTNSKKKST